VRNALILLAVVAGIILVAGAFNNGVVFDIDYVAGTATKVSLFWVSGIVAAIIFVAGLAASWFALSSAGGARRKLEAELQTTYERLRETETRADEARAAAQAAEARVAQPPAVGASETTVVDEREAVTVVADEAETVVVASDEESETVVVAAGEDETALVTPDDAEGAAPAAAPAAEAGEQAGLAAGDAGEQTAVTMVAGADSEEAGAAGEPGEGDAVAPDDEKGPAPS
jgi:hypothetical protein